MTVLVTGSKGMIGSQVVNGLLKAGYDVVGIDLVDDNRIMDHYRYYKTDLSDKEMLQKIVRENQAERLIHLAALAHTAGENDLSWDRYYHVNVACAKNVFQAAGENPVLFISTVDVFGFYDGKQPVSGSTELHPVTNYGKSKALAEQECMKLAHYTIFRFSPVYTDVIKRDIRKRYYLKYPAIAYQIGKGTHYEILNVNLAVAAMVDWCKEGPRNEIRIIKDDTPMWTPDYIHAEKAAGRAKVVLKFPKWLITLGYHVLHAVPGENEKTYLLNKAVYPLRSE